MDELKRKFVLVAQTHWDEIEVQRKLALGLSQGVFTNACSARMAAPICSIALVKSQALEQVLRSWASQGLIEAHEKGFRACTRVDYRRLAYLFEGLAVSSDVFPPPPQVDLVATISDNALYLLKKMNRFDVYKPDYHDTESLFKALAAKSTREFVVMSPFIDAKSEDYLLNLFDNCAEDVMKVMILRSKEFEPSRFNALLRRLKDRGVIVHDYLMNHTCTSSTLHFETFHAKVLMADRELTYVGSANMTAVSRSVSMELGAFIHCKEFGIQLGKILDCVKGACEV